jgi:hypothetical protein
MKVKRLSQVNELISSLMEHPRQAPINVMVICPYQHPSEGFFAGGPFLLPGNLLTSRRLGCFLCWREGHFCS